MHILKRPCNAVFLGRLCLVVKFHCGGSATKGATSFSKITGINHMVIDFFIIDLLIKANPRQTTKYPCKK